MKNICVLALLSVFSLVVKAADPVKVVAGSKAFLNERATATVSFTWNNAQWMDGDLMVNEMNEIEFENRTSVAPEKFMEGFNMNSKRLVIKETGQTPKYSIAIDVYKVDYFFSVTSIPPGHKYTIWARVIVTDLETNKEVCTMLVDRLKGDRDFVKDDAFAKLFVALGEAIAS